MRHSQSLRRAGQFVLRKVRGHWHAVRYAAICWWENQVESWVSVMARRPTFANSFPMLAMFMRGLAYVVGFFRWTFASPARTWMVACALFWSIANPTAYAFAMMGPIRHLRSYEQIAPLALTPAADAGQRRFIELNQNKATRYIQVRVVATVDIAVAVATAVRNLGMVEALFSEMGITGGGDGDIVKGDPLALSFASDWMLPNSIWTRQRLTSTAIATTGVRSQFRIWLENPRSVRPRETVLLQKEPQNKLLFFATLKNVSTGAATSSAGSGAIVQGAGTTVVTLSGITISVQQISHTGLLDLPYFRPRVTQIYQALPQVGADIPVAIPVEGNEYLRGLTVMFFNANEMEDVALNADIASFVLSSDNFNYLGAGIKVDFQDYLRGESFEASGDVVTWNGRALHYDFQQEGRLSNIYNPGQDSNLKLVLNVAVVPAGFAVIVLKHSLMRDKYVGTDGRVVVAPQLPDELAEPVPTAA